MLGKFTGVIRKLSHEQECFKNLIEDSLTAKILQTLLMKIEYANEGFRYWLEIPIINLLKIKQIKNITLFRICYI